MTAKIWNTLAIVVVLAAWGLVGTWDVEDAEAQAQRYCDNVKARHWPDYQRTYKRDCLKPKAASPRACHVEPYGVRVAFVKESRNSRIKLL